ncbi:transposase [Corynebacterium accolens]|uniref:transposase n=1 Tax=Corynebacterium accolens TaxID=38284 RepID=UPI00266F13C8|nr:transposase [Corynebacterium accolens]WKS66791.1 transposase [Corynebacterium accolens]
MSRYSEQFKRDAVALYENNEDLSLNSASAELGINRASLHSWVTGFMVLNASPQASRKTRRIPRSITRKSHES